MADDSEGELILDTGEAGLGFKFEMATSNFILGYWKAILGVIGIGLLSVLVYGELQNQNRKWQRSYASDISDVLEKLPADLQQLPLRMKFDEDLISNEDLIGVGDELLVLADSASGAGRIEAIMKAAEIYRIAGASNQQRAALDKAGAEVQGPLQYAVVSALANMDLEAGEGDTAVGRLRGLTSHADAYLARKASEDLGLALEFLDRDAEAAAVYDEFLAKWPESPEAEAIRARQGRLETEG